MTTHAFLPTARIGVPKARPQHTRLQDGTRLWIAQPYTAEHTGTGMMSTVHVAPR
jgi:hypothetical protein